jgi:hypothetical protein
MNSGKIRSNVVTERLAWVREMPVSVKKMPLGKSDKLDQKI